MYQFICLYNFMVASHLFPCLDKQIRIALEEILLVSDPGVDVNLSAKAVLESAPDPEADELKETKEEDGIPPLSFPLPEVVSEILLEPDKRALNGVKHISH
jgi:hypothetical protein